MLLTNNMCPSVHFIIVYNKPLIKYRIDNSNSRRHSSGIDATSERTLRIWQLWAYIVSALFVQIIILSALCVRVGGAVASRCSQTLRHTHGADKYPDN